MTSPNPFAPPGPATPPARTFPAQPYGAQPYPAQPYPGQPYPGQPYPSQPYDRARYDAGYEAGYDAGWEDGYTGARYPVPAPGAEDSEIDPADVAQRTFGEQGPVGVYGVTVVDVSLDADDVVLPAFPGNVPADGRYVLATISVTNLGTEPARPAMDLYHYYEGDDELLYGDWSCMSWTPRPLADTGPLAPGETVEYDVCFDVPLDALGRQTVLVDDATAMAYRLTQWSAPDAA